MAAEEGFTTNGSQSLSSNSSTSFSANPSEDGQQSHTPIEEKLPTIGSNSKRTVSLYDAQDAALFSPGEQLGQEKEKLKARCSEFSKLDECDIVLLVVHGASFASSQFHGNIRNFLATLDKVQKMWFWELDPLNIHVEMIDWKSVLSPYQNKLLAKVTPTVSGVGPVEPAVKSPVRSQRPSFASPLIDLFKWVASDVEAPDSQEPEPKIAMERDDPETGQKVSSESDSAVDLQQEDPARIGEENITDFNDLIKRHGNRLYFNNTVADVFCYLTPRFGNFMTNEICKLLNNKVAALRSESSGKFRESKIVLVGHSLGSLILYELLTGKKCRNVSQHIREEDELDPVSSPCPDVPLPPIQADEDPRLNFSVSHFFMWGSPLGSLLLLNNNRELSLRRPSPFVHHSSQLQPGTNHPKTRFYNIFHKSDPVAMRVEPVYYAHMATVPPPVMLPNFKSNGDADWRRGLDFVRDTSSTIKYAATEMMARLFTGAGGLQVEGLTDGEVQEFINARRYALPDALKKKSRYGILDVKAAGTPDGDELPDNATPGSRRGLAERLFSHGSFEGISTSEDGSSRVWRGASHRSANSADPLPPQPSFQVGKGDLHESGSAVLASAAEKFMFAKNLRRKKKLETYNKPWTARQWALQLAVRVRRGTSRVLEERLQDRQVASEVPRMRESAYAMIDAEVDDFLRAVVSGSSVAAASGELGSRKTWIDNTTRFDLRRTEWLCRKELIKEMNQEVSEEEGENGDQLPLRMDFMVSESFQEFVLAPLALLQSHLGYWACGDTVFFMMKEMTNFRPRLSREKRDQILWAAQKARKKILAKLHKIIPKP